MNDRCANVVVALGRPKGMLVLFEKDRDASRG